jgi:hypothetical protein
MLLGHYAPALVLKRTTPAIPLWVLFLSTQFLDLLWGPFILTGVEHCRIVPHFTASNDLDLYDMPWSHSLAMAVVWSLVCGAIAIALRPKWGARGKVFAVIALAVFSHWVADFFVHASDLPIAPGVATKVGLGLWRNLPIALALETGILIVAIAVAPKMRRTWMLWALLPPVAAITFFIPTPPSPKMMAVTGLLTYAIYAVIPWRAEGTSQA